MTKKTIIVEKFTGSRGWMVFWVLVFWPMAIYYYVTRKSAVEVKVKTE